MTLPDDPRADASPSPRPTPSSRDAREVVTWAAFFGLASIWGSSFLFIHVALDEGVPVFTLVSVRTLAGAVFLGIVLLAVRGGLPATREAWRRCVTLAFIQIVIPFLLIAWGQQFIATGIAGVLNALTPLFAVILASLVL